MPYDEDSGTIFQATIKDQDEVVVDITDADVIFHFINPRGVVSWKTGTVTDGPAGLCQYVSEPDFLDTAGTWTWYVTVTLLAGSWSSDPETFVVYASDIVTPTTPDLGTDKTCKVTGTFYDAKGDYMEGVYIRFTPSRDTTAFLTSGIVAAEVTTSSDANGEVEFYLARGLTGLLSITGVGIVKKITVPDQATIDIQDLVDLGTDLLEVQTQVFYPLPRRS